MHTRLLILIASLLLVGCKPSGPASTTTTSSGFSTVAERAAFLGKYVTFNRTYETLDFDITFQNNAGGMVAGPSDWDLRVVATVPASELQTWVPAGVQPTAQPNLDWIKSVPTTLGLSGVSEWYIDGKKIVGLDRNRRIVVYRASSN